MQTIISELLDTRIDEILRKLPDVDPDYALAQKKCADLYDMIDPILSHEGNITLCRGDTLNICNFLEHDAASACIAHKALYKQGYLDCVKLLSILGILA